MNKQYIQKGTLTIENQILKIGNKTINIANIDNMETFPLEKYSLTNGLADWVKAWIVFFIICVIFKNNITEIILILYTLSIIGLLYYNYKEHQKQFYALVIKSSRSTLGICSENENFLKDILKALEKAMNSKKVSYTINLDNNIINNGIVNNGDNNINKVTKNDNDN